MSIRFLVFLAAFVLFAGPTAFAQMKSEPASPGCDPGDRIDGVTLERARDKLNKAGFSQVTQLKKACDNFWHSRAIKDGKPVNVLLTPAGEAMIEGD